MRVYFLWNVELTLCRPCLQGSLRHACQHVVIKVFKRFNNSSPLVNLLSPRIFPW